MTEQLKNNKWSEAAQQVGRWFGSSQCPWLQQGPLQVGGGVGRQSSGMPVRTHCVGDEKGQALRD